MPSSQDFNNRIVDFTMQDFKRQNRGKDMAGNQREMPESLQRFNLVLSFTEVSDLGKRTLPAHLTDLHAVAAGVPAVVRLEP